MREWFNLARESLLDPRSGALRLLAAEIPAQVPMLVLALVSVMNGLVYGLILSPILLALVSGGVIWVSAWLLSVIGAQLGGHAGVSVMLRVVLWLQLIRLAVQIALVVIGFAIPPLAPIVSMVAGIWMLYMAVCFIAAAHGFETRWKAVALLAAVFVLTLVLASLLVASVGEPAFLMD
ncbi:hypothetical protein SAMN06297129_2369 [Pseudooceanicola antarcticus]|uniref:Yip1 domain-containing protein n=1 Tax=Pseudooceanicola antarcticus TaxID=1247613 RepID=A0A285IXV8_9RHOB|nr:YIP1 family protein [Pseudooceanicola antarcticus]PJE25836.1 hypothetical protein CVM39_19230 [Pseudooceanicola antarcticus]SNY52663.1 hypothetical protein SAMN06297129_2369 [Pseudooceanicola antarcticus]